MALVKCPKCGAEVSTLAESCPGCSAPVGSGSKTEYRFVDDFGNETLIDQHSFVELVEGAEAGDTKSCTILGIYYLEEGDIQRARDLLVPAMNEKSVVATYNLAKIERILARRHPENPDYLSWQRKFLEATAGSDYAPAQNDLALLVHKEDPARAFELAKSAVEGNLAKANYTLGMFYRNGIGVAPDDEMALSYLAIAGDHKVENSYLPLARIHARGVGTTQNLEAAADWYAKAAIYDEDDLDECLQFFKEHLEFKSQLEDVVTSFADRIGKGESHLAGPLGIALFKNTEHRRTACYLEMAAEQGNGEAMYWLSGLYKRDTPEGRQKAESLLRASADHGFVRGQIHVGAMLFKSNPGKAFELISAAAESGSLEGKHHLARFFMMGISVEKDLSKYSSMLQELADAGYEPAFEDTGKMYKIGIGVPHDFRAARYWLEKALNCTEDQNERSEIAAELNELTQIENRNAAPAEVVVKRAGRSDEAPYADIVIWARSADSDSWHRYGDLAPSEGYKITLSPGSYTFRACVGTEFDEDYDDESEGDDYVDVDVDLESHDDVKLVAKAWGDLYVDFERRR